MERYKELGYVYTKYLDPVLVRTEHLAEGSVALVTVRCDSCGRVKCIMYKDYGPKEGGPYYCVHCTSRKTQGLSLREVQEAFIRSGYLPMFTSYTNAAELLDYWCPTHPHLLQRIRYGNLKAGQGCPLCGAARRGLKRRGSGHPNYKGGITPFTLGIRKYVRPWSLQVFAEYGNACVLTGETQQLEVHHVNGSFRQVLQETIDELNINLQKQIGDYSKEALEEIGKVLLEKHVNIRGVPLAKRLHKLFHKKYGKVGFTEEDFNQFCEDYRNGLLEEDN